MAVRFVFSVEDLARTRLAISPIWELVRSLLALRDPSTAAIHVPWLRTLDGRLDGIAIEPAVALMPPRGFIPDFLMPAPTGPLGDIRDDLAALRATPRHQVVADMELFRSQHPRSRVAAEWLAHPRRELNRLGQTLEAYWDRALEPVWPRIRAFLEADVAHRARQLAEGGHATLFADLHPAVRWLDDCVEVIVPEHNATMPLAGRGLLLIPSAFAWTRPVVTDREPWQPSLIYPARGVGALWDAGVTASGGVARLLGATRAAVLATLDAPHSTTELAERLTISPANASHHLTAMREAGLVTARRDGRFVLYVRTAMGDALLGDIAARVT